MLVRIVKMKFKEEAIEKFQELFQNSKEKIRHFEGCQRLELYQDQKDSSQFFTYSYWVSEEYLNNYRNSALFAEVWKATKAGFSEKAQAWSLDKLVELD
ncbi:putative quinol monooxygenase [Psychroflexus sp. MES1-P1E]|uniref:putative quinol monooxygenase n=1 Tax=Psychroflexus sp. MES1-P1E TaxID=2058320 RepID=UPI000C7B52D9|nr:antibiotic biosynthesis monooxygenase family protein [Psychroflexus sp. MES1-P1E]PKG42930.1 antibiotic biosynthesis monooxygenase [Psychroflexus sp. MES1-P1E]